MKKYAEHPDRQFDDGRTFDAKDKRIADLEAKLAKSQQELAELRGVHRQMVEGMNGLGERLIDDTCG